MFIIFDLDDTLIDTSGSILPIKAKRALQRMVDAGLKIVDKQKAEIELFEDLKKAMTSKEGLTKFLSPHQLNFLPHGLEEIYRGSLEGIEIKPLPYAEEVLGELAKNHLLAIATAGHTEHQIQKLRRSGIDLNLFYRIEVMQMGDKKKFYRHMLDELQIPSKNTYVCGDRIPIDLIPAKELGLNTIHMRWGRGENFTEEIEKVDYTIYELRELKKII